MVKFVGRRLAVGVVFLVVFSFVMFWLIESFIPGDYFSIFRLGMSAEEVEALREAYGVNLPIHIRWWRWLQGFFEGGLGETTTGGRVSWNLGGAIASTVFVFVTGLAIAYVIGQWLGRSTGWRGGLRSDGITLAGVSLSTLFPPFAGFVVTSVLALRLRQWRARFFEDERRELWLDAPLSETQFLNRMTMALALGMLLSAVLGAVWWRLRRKRITPGVQLLMAFGVMLGLWAALGIMPWAIDLAFDAMLPLIAFVVLAFGEFMLIMQAGVVGQLNEDYVGTARAKGLRERTIRDRHASKNAVLALVARLAVSIPYLMTGLVIIERAVSWPGIGTMLFSSIESQDIPTVVSVLMVIGVVTMITRLVLEIITYALDPRIAHPVEIQA
ncbi:MAG: ABC transporter permease [Acidimicrobiia bacterium]